MSYIHFRVGAKDAGEKGSSRSVGCPYRPVPVNAAGGAYVEPAGQVPPGDRAPA
jgi:hypothetical protein